MDQQGQGGGKDLHRRAHSDVHLSIPEDLNLLSDPFDVPSQDDDRLSLMDIDNNNLRNDNVVVNGLLFDEKGEQSGTKKSNNVEDDDVGPRHRHCNSVDVSSTAVRIKKALSPDKLAELWAVDPKRAKRILANRQSAARSKQRKAQNMAELERELQTLQTKVTTYSEQLMLLQRDATDLTSENSELKLRLQYLEQEVRLRDALNEALKKDVERLKHATGEGMTPTASFNFFPQNLQMHRSHPAEPQDFHMLQVHHLQPELSTAGQPSLAAPQLRVFPDMFQQDPLGRMQRLEITGRNTHLMTSQGPSESVGESTGCLVAKKVEHADKLTPSIPIGPFL